ncbi:MAG: DNA gyrase C-terminal beta-propeller domain-containing protein, partial [Lapillicoccus sp.]
VRVAQVSERGGDLVGALTVAEDDEVMVVMEKGKIVRSRVDEVRRTGRNTMGVIFAAPDKGDSIVAVARNVERVVLGDELVEGATDASADPSADVSADVSTDEALTEISASDGVPSEEIPETDDPSDDASDDTDGGSE